MTVLSFNWYRTWMPEELNINIVKFILMWPSLTSLIWKVTSLHWRLSYGWIKDVDFIHWLWTLNLVLCLFLCFSKHYVCLFLRRRVKHKCHWFLMKDFSENCYNCIQELSWKTNSRINSKRRDYIKHLKILKHIFELNIFNIGQNVRLIL